MAVKILLFSFFFLFVQILAGKDEPSLGLIREEQKDADKSRGKQPLRWGSVLTFPKVKDVYKEILNDDPKKLSEISRNAYWQMNKKWNEDIPTTKPKNQAKVMTALAVGNEIFLSSSLIGAQNFIYKFGAASKNHPLLVGLNRCQQNLEDAWKPELDGSPDNGFIRPDGVMNERWPKHKNNAMCGEEMTLLSYFTRHPEDGAKDKLKGAHFVTVQMKRGQNDDPSKPVYENIIRFDPCGTEYLKETKPSEFGCGQLSLYYGITAIHHDENLTTEEFTPFELPKGDGEMVINSQSITCKDDNGEGPSNSR